ncbi:hypothetical protein EW146_g9515 [Bondarzewia mesenterica]|uniref:Uncharacterized protein n=1 Tax=Bondarzewia mesenterica TaxID=1095465 RepID=A0A4S4L5J0_9AGAM|nr:hypothetical protein EW146_g9515 [Bondarzewia mesenterica]
MNHPTLDFELDSEGKPIRNPYTGYQVTPLAREARHQVRHSHFSSSIFLIFLRNIWREQKKKAPMSQLPDDFNVKLNPKAPKLYFGLPFNYEEHIVPYAKAHNLVYYLDRYPNEINPVDTIPAVLDYLEYCCDAKLYFKLPFGPSLQGMIALYSNYTMEEDHLLPDDEKEVIEIIKKELGIEIEAKWYWDRFQASQHT